MTGVECAILSFPEQIENAILNNLTYFCMRLDCKISTKLNMHKKFLYVIKNNKKFVMAFFSQYHIICNTTY